MISCKPVVILEQPMCQVHTYFAFGFLADALRQELLDRLGPSSNLPPPRVILGVPLAEGMLPEELLAAMASVRTAVLFEGYEFDRVARKHGRAQIAHALQERGIAVDWLAEADLPGVVDRSMTMQCSLEAIARSLCDRAGVPRNTSVAQEKT